MTPSDRAAAPPISRRDRRISPVFLAIVAVMAVAGWALYQDKLSNTGVSVFVFVTAGWVVSLCLHEYAHARTALHSGDISIGAKGYLTLNPLKYTHAVLSILLPLLFVMLGGIGLPGGAVFIERHRINERWKHSLISAMGPLTNALLAVVIGVAFKAGWLDDAPLAFRSALAFLALLQVTAAILNFVPIPGLDGYGVIEPWLSPQTRAKVAPYAGLGLMAVFALFMMPSLNNAFFDAVYGVLDWLGISDLEAALGSDWYRFWDGTPGSS